MEHIIFYLKQTRSYMVFTLYTCKYLQNAFVKKNKSIPFISSFIASFIGSFIKNFEIKKIIFKLRPIMRVQKGPRAISFTTKSKLLYLRPIMNPNTIAKLILHYRK